MPIRHHTYRFFRRGLTFVLGGVLLLRIFAAASLAQVTLDGSVGPSGPLSGPDYTISAEVGQIRNSNLFHSFGQFNINMGESATFTGPNTIENIVSRVTGGASSHIDGMVRSDISGANLFLLNPSGILFGPNARLNVSGSFHVSTADYLQLQDGNRFVAHLGEQSMLTAAPPAAFGFLGRSPPRAITIQGSRLQVRRGSDLSIVGGNITVEQGTVRAPGGQLYLASMAAAGEVSLTSVGQGQAGSLAASAQLGTIRLNDAVLSTNGNDGGRVVIRSGELLVEQATLSADNDGSMDSPGVGVDIDVTGRIVFTNSNLTSRSFRSGDGGDVLVRASRVDLTDDSFITTASRSIGSGGDITVTAGDVAIDRGASILSTTLSDSTGNGGDIRVRAANVIITEEGGGEASTGIFSFAGSNSEPGVVRIEAGRLEMRGGILGTSPITARQVGAPRVGNVVVRVGQLRLTDAARIDSSTFSEFSGGSVQISAVEAELRGGAVITAGTMGEGRAGDIQLTVERLTMTGGASIDSSTSGRAKGGMIRITATDVRLTDGAMIAAEASNAGDAGNIVIDVHRLRLRNGRITAKAEGGGGEITITAQESVILMNSEINTEVQDGAGGNITIHNPKFVFLENSQILATAGEGVGGDIDIETQVLLGDAASDINVMARVGTDGTIRIDAIVANISSDITPLPQERFASAQPLADRRWQNAFGEDT